MIRNINLIAWAVLVVGALLMVASGVSNLPDEILTRALLWMLGFVILLTGAALLVMGFAKEELPDSPTKLQKLRHALWQFL